MIRIDGLPVPTVRARREAPEGIPLSLLVACSSCGHEHALPMPGAEAPVDLREQRLQLCERFRCEACENRLADVIRIGRPEAA
jgi:RNase P subunit RPR2